MEDSQPAENQPAEPKVYGFLPHVLNYSKEHGGHFTIRVDHREYTILSDDPLFERAVAAFRARDIETMLDMLDRTRAVKRFFYQHGGVTVANGIVTYQGRVLHGVVIQKIFESIQMGDEHTHLIRFVDRLMENPSKRAVEELYTFLDANKFTISEVGTFFAYKSVRADYKDWHSNKFDNTPGTEHSMPRNAVDDDKDRTCSDGFHAGALAYVSTFHAHEGRKVLVEIDPADVVAIPSDCNATKLRTCRYRVVEDYTGALIEPLRRSIWAQDPDFRFNDYTGDYRDEDGAGDFGVCPKCGSEYGDCGEGHCEHDDDVDDSEHDADAA